MCVCGKDVTSMWYVCDMSRLSVEESYMCIVALHLGKGIGVPWFMHVCCINVLHYEGDIINFDMLSESWCDCIAWYEHREITIFINAVPYITFDSFTRHIAIWSRKLLLVYQSHVNTIWDGHHPSSAISHPLFIDAACKTISAPLPNFSVNSWLPKLLHLKTTLHDY